MQQPLDDERRIIQEILNYLVRRPEAGDTIENIVLWWIPAERLRPLREQVEEALAFLVRKDLIVETVLPGGKKWYRANPAKKSEMTQWVQILS